MATTTCAIWILCVRSVDRQTRLSSLRVSKHIGQQSPRQGTSMLATSKCIWKEETREIMELLCKCESGFLAYSIEKFYFSRWDCYFLNQRCCKATFLDTSVHRQSSEMYQRHSLRPVLRLHMKHMTVCVIWMCTTQHAISMGITRYIRLDPTTCFLPNTRVMKLVMSSRVQCMTWLTWLSALWERSYLQDNDYAWHGTM